MPELPEVHTTIGLNKTIRGLKITGVWTDLAKKNQSIPHFKETLKNESFYKKFQKEALGTKIIKAKRRAKNILLYLSNKKIILIHMKMTGHLLYGTYEYNKKKNGWDVAKKEKNDALRDPFNRFIHVVFTFNNKKHLVLCDSRKFAKVTLFSSLLDLEKHFKDFGPEPLDKSFTLEKFKNALRKKPTGKIKQVLMDQTILAGIGNIYSDEMLWLAGIHPKRLIKSIKEPEYKKLFDAMKKVLNQGIDFGGDSTSDYRKIDGTPGNFHHAHNVYRKTKSVCSKKGCSGVIIREVISGRGAHFCNTHQK